MGYVQFILNNRKKAQTALPSAPIPSDGIDLPGLKRGRKNINAAERAQKREYTRLLRERQELIKKVNGKKGAEKKEMRERISYLKREMKVLLEKIGVYTKSEEAMGFAEVVDGE